MKFGRLILKNKNAKIFIIGTGNMSRNYYRHIKFLEKECYLLFRDKESVNYKKAKEEFGESSLLNISKSRKMKCDLLLSCVGPENHIKSIKPFVNSTTILAVEKPASLDIEELSTFKNKKNTFVLMNRRYYYWVSKVYELIKQRKVKKIIVNLPEKKSSKLWNTMPDSLIKNSIHVFDLLFYLCGELHKPTFIKKSSDSLFLISESANVKEIFFHINFDYIESFSIRFYLEDKSIIECLPLEQARIYKKFNLIEPNKKDFVRKYKPEFNSIDNKNISMDYQKPGILELCKDLVEFSCETSSKTNKLPNIEESIKVMRWIKNICLY